jgi:signal transduction histidine kinase
MNTDIAFGIVVGLLFISLVILFCAIIIKLYIRKIKNHTQELFRKDIEFQKTIHTTIIETQEHVLKNISQELHDDAGQQLTYINFQLENLKLDFPDSNVNFLPVSNSVSKLSDSIRSLSHSLSNELLSKQDLIKAIKTEVERLSTNKTIKINFSCPRKIEKIFSVNEKIIIYRIFQETINNCFKHSKASLIDITILNYTGFKLTITDNGKGFQYPLPEANTLSLGLKNMINRAAIINYNIKITSSPENGTAISLQDVEV